MNLLTEFDSESRLLLVKSVNPVAPFSGVNPRICDRFWSGFNLIWFSKLINLPVTRFPQKRFGNLVAIDETTFSADIWRMTPLKLPFRFVTTFDTVLTAFVAAVDYIDWALAERQKIDQLCQSEPFQRIYRELGSPTLARCVADRLPSFRGGCTPQ